MSFSHATPASESRLPVTVLSGFLGQQMDEATMRARLDACLLDERLAAADSDAWAELPNPFPEPRMDEAPA